MKIEVTFSAEPGDSGEFANLDGKRFTMEGVDNVDVSTHVDTVPGAQPGTRFPLETGQFVVSAHGKRAMWSDPDG
jgi:hypothetical protein